MKNPPSNNLSSNLFCKTIFVKQLFAGHSILFSMISSELYLSIIKIIRLHSTNKNLIIFWHMFKILNRDKTTSLTKMSPSLPHWICSHFDKLSGDLFMKYIRLSSLKIRCNNCKLICCLFLLCQVFFQVWAYCCYRWDFERSFHMISSPFGKHS